MGNKPPKENDWDRRPWPVSGESTCEAIFTAVGRALTEWESHEGALSVLFAVLVSPILKTKAGMRAYSAVRTFEGRAEMLRAASLASFDSDPDEGHQTEFKRILARSLSFSPRRNEITHASVLRFGSTDDETYALYPAYASFRERDLNNNPSYCMTAKEINYFADHFKSLRSPILDLTTGLSTRAARASHR
jgi:hypothetical protein